MAINPNYPGVYIEEVPSGVRTITGVATSVTAFVGYTRKGTPNKAVSVSSFADFERSFGGLDQESPLSYSVRQYFSNGGTEAIVVRVADQYEIAWCELKKNGTEVVLRIEASSPGNWGNDIRIQVQHTGTRNLDAEFNLVISQVVNEGGQTQAVRQEIHRNLNLNPRSPNFIEAVVNSVSQLVKVTRIDNLRFTNAGFAVSDTISFPLTVTDNLIAGTVGTVERDELFRLELASTPGDMTKMVTMVNEAINAAGLGNNLLASESGLDGADGNGSLKIESIEPGESSIVKISSGIYGGFTAVIGLGLTNGGREFTGDAQYRPDEVSDAVQLNEIPLTQGVDGTKGGAAALAGSESAKKGIYALLDVDMFNLLCIPETRDLAEGQTNSVIQAAVSLCEQRRAFYIVDAPSSKTLSDVAKWAYDACQSRSAAVYFPGILISDPLDAFRQRNMAPSGSIAGVYARTDSTRGVWKAPAGTDATLNGVAGVSIPINDIENGKINPKGVNALRSLPAYGKVIWGARTMKGADAQADEYKYIPVRRLALFIEESLYRGTQWVVFEPNDEPLWSQIRLNIGAFMQNLFRQGAFQGKSPREAYFVKCDRETTIQNDINLGIVNIHVGFAPLKPAEFVVIKIQQMAGQVEA